MVGGLQQGEDVDGWEVATSAGYRGIQEWEKGGRWKPRPSNSSPGICTRGGVEECVEEYIQSEPQNVGIIGGSGI